MLSVAGMVLTVAHVGITSYHSLVQLKSLLVFGSLRLRHYSMEVL